MTTTTDKPVGLYLLLFCLLFIGGGGLFGGIAFLLEPSGSYLGMTPAFLPSFGLTSYVLPGLFLLTVMGVIPLVLAVVLWRRPTWHWGERYHALTHEHWSWTATMLFSYLLLGWLLVQAGLIGFTAPMQWVTALVGLALYAFCHLPAVRRYYATP